MIDAVVVLQLPHFDHNVLAELQAGRALRAVDGRVKGVVHEHRGVVKLDVVDHALQLTADRRLENNEIDLAVEVQVRALLLDAAITALGLDLSEGNRDSFKTVKI